MAHRLNVVNPAASSPHFPPSNYAGAEADFTVNTKLTKHLDMLVGYSHFFAGSYLNDTGAGDDADFAYLMLTLNY